MGSDDYWREIATLYLINEQRPVCERQRGYTMRCISSNSRNNLGACLHSQESGYMFIDDRWWDQGRDWSIGNEHRVCGGKVRDKGREEEATGMADMGTLISSLSEDTDSW